ncbi:sialidase family protein [Rhizobium sp. GN54]|uniref:sialidase family protein n=1 Tax=Rhizobium sp. GN54 TaxID=2898150 RepID=UPI001E367ACE|nr:sialidase family protein [Rhizobium sp. GN54]MCD2184777.1 glycoside hydrolase [Rhizobium sp. GN54]
MTTPVAPPSFSSFATTPQPLELNVFVDHEKNGRSGHLGHAAFQRQDGEIFAFYPSCSSDDPGRHGTSGHSAAGWMEYKRSSDGGQSWSEPEPLAYSQQNYLDKSGSAIFTEKGIVTDNGTIVLFHLISDISVDALWEPYLVPTSTRSTDDGLTWSDPVEIGAEKGRVYGACYLDGVIYALKFRNDAVVDFCGTTDEHIYTLYASHDDGATFTEVSDLPFNTLGRGYGTLCALNDGRLIAYVYHKRDEEYLDYCISSDKGLSWSAPQKSRFAKRIRNPQMIAFKGGYFLHGRSGSYGPVEGKGHFVLYYSTDGVNWDEGRYLAMRTHGQGAYSNSIVVTVPGTGAQRLRIQASHAYSNDSTNICEWFVELVDQ